jgi:hypothetical protein
MHYNNTIAVPRVQEIRLLYLNSSIERFLNITIIILSIFFSSFDKDSTVVTIFCCVNAIFSIA